MTLFCWAARRTFALPEPEARLFQVAPDTQVLAHCYWLNDRERRPTLLALHGLEGSSAAHYMQGLAQKALAAGFNAIIADGSYGRILARWQTANVAVAKAEVNPVLK